MNQSILEVRHLRTLVALRDSGSLVRAAQLLSLTQSALSHQIKLLEDRLGKRLFRKSGRRLELTDEGRVALRYADEIFGLGCELVDARDAGDWCDTLLLGRVLSRSRGRL